MTPLNALQRMEAAIHSQADDGSGHQNLGGTFFAGGGYDGGFNGEPAEIYGNADPSTDPGCAGLDRM